MKIMRLILTCLCFLCSIVYFYCKTNFEPGALPDKQLVLQPDFSDEFNGSALDTIKWDNDVRDWGVWSWEPENVWVKDGHLNVRMQYQEHMRGDKQLYYTSGIIKSRAAPIRYGYFEARIKAAPRYPGVCPAFWVYRKENKLWTEIDFVELTEQRKGVRLVDTNTHVFYHPQLATGKELHERRTWEAPWDPRDDFHVYACEWTAKEIKWYVDDELIKTRANGYWHQPLDVVISFGVRYPLKTEPSAEGFPTVFQVDYVRVWQSVFK
jgi:beta-glucanase (GH16 family)